MTNITEEKLKMENDTANLKREYKYALENLAKVKSDTNDVLTIKENTLTLIGQKTNELNNLSIEISSLKLAWMQEKSREMEEISTKKSEADNVIKRKAELNKQEEEIRKIEASDILARDEARRLEFKNEQTTTAFEVRENEIKNHYKEIERREKKLDKDISNFKLSVVKALEQVNNISI